MFKNILEYQRAYFECLYKPFEFDGGYFTSSKDLEYINANSIIVEEATDDIVASICLLLAGGLETTKIQFPKAALEFGDEQECMYLIKYHNQLANADSKVNIEIVDCNNYEQFLKLSEKLQIQEYGKVYKSHTNQDLLNQSQFKQYMITVGGNHVGEFVYIPTVCALESLIIDARYQRMGIGTQVLNQVYIQTNKPIYMSADNSSIEFYRRIDAEIIDKCDVINLYGNSRNLLMYLSLL